MKQIRLAALLLAFALTMSGCMHASTFHYSVSATPAMSGARMRVGTPLTVVLPASLRDQELIVRGQGFVAIQIDNFKRAIGEALRAGFAANFSEVRVASQESKRGLELVVLDAQVGNHADTLSYHVVLSDDGRDVYETKGEIQAPLKVISTTIFTWQADTARVVSDFAAENISKMVDAINSKILLNDDPRLIALWEKQPVLTASSGTEIASPDALDPAQY